MLQNAREILASEHNLNYIALEGDIGCMGELVAIMCNFSLGSYHRCQKWLFTHDSIVAQGSLLEVVYALQSFCPARTLKYFCGAQFAL